MSNLLFALIALHGGEVFELDRNLTAEDCAYLAQPGQITFFEGYQGHNVRPDATTRISCEPHAPADVIIQRRAPETNPKFADGLNRTGPKILQYGANRMAPGAYESIMRATGIRMKGRRGRPRKAR